MYYLQGINQHHMYTLLHTPEFWVGIITVTLVFWYRISTSPGRSKSTMDKYVKGGPPYIQDPMKVTAYFDQLERNDHLYLEELRAQELRKTQPVIGNDFDIDHKEQEGTDPYQWHHTTDYDAACKDAARAAMAVHLYSRWTIESVFPGYKWRVERVKAEVELPRKEALPGVESTTFKLTFDAIWYKGEDDKEKRATDTYRVLNNLIQHYKKRDFIPNAKGISDGYHTFQELYDMRLALTVAAFKAVDRKWHAQWKMTGAHHRRPFKTPIWRSHKHSDDTMFEGMFIVGYAQANFLQITFHYHDEHWDKFDFCNTLDKAPEWDGHTDKDVIERLLAL